MRRKETLAMKFEKSGPWKFNRREEGDFKPEYGKHGIHALVFVNPQGKEMKVGETAARKYLKYDGENARGELAKPRVQVMLEKTTYDKLDKLAHNLKNSESDVCARILTEALRDRDWLKKVLVDPTLKAIDSVVQD